MGHPDRDHSTDGDAWLIHRSSIPREAQVRERAPSTGTGRRAAFRHVRRRVHAQASCATFEVLLRSFEITDAALGPLGR